MYQVSELVSFIYIINRDVAVVATFFSSFISWNVLKSEYDVWSMNKS